MPVWLLLGTALAHKPSFSDGQYDSASNAFQVEEPEVSMVLYHEVTCDSPQLWMQLWTEPEAPTYIQLGVPIIDRLEDYRPSIAMLAPGLPALEPDAVPFDIPAGLGGVVFHADEDEAAPDTFYEPFTQTASWVLVEENVSVSTAGEAYLVAWNPEGMTGKLWIATGTVEDFGPDDWDNFGMWLERVRTHHEVEGFEPAEPPEEQDCQDESDAGPNQTGPKSTRCSTITDAPSLWALSLVALMSWRRRRPGSAQPS